MSVWLTVATRFSMGGTEANTAVRSSLVVRARTPPPSFQWEKGAEHPAVDRKAQNAVGSCRSAMIFSHQSGNRAREAVYGPGAKTR